MIDLDALPKDYSSFERDLKKRGIAWVTSDDDAQRLRALCAGWIKEARPLFASELGEPELLVEIDDEVRWLRSRCGRRTRADELRQRLRQVARVLEREILPAYDTSRWSQAASAGNRSSSPLSSRLDAVSERVGASYEQACRDLADEGRLTYVGPATELREVLRATIAELSPPDEQIREQPWFKGHENKPTQAERIRAILGDKERAKPPIRTLEIIDGAIGAVGRMTYVRASGATHLGREAPREEVVKLRGWVEAVLGEVLPATS